MKLKCHPRFDLGDRRGLSRRIYVVDEQGENVPAYEFMTDCIDSDIQSVEGSGAMFMRCISEVESGSVPIIDFSGNAWTVYVTPQKVWFEGAYSQGDGGDVTTKQFRFAVENFLRFFSDPDRKPIEVEFPSH